MGLFYFMTYRVDSPFSGSFHKKFPVGSFVETEKVDGNFVWFNGCYIARAKEFFECCTVVDQKPDSELTSPAP